MRRRGLFAATAMIFVVACSAEKGTNLDGQDVRLTLLHTSDIHSRLLPYNLEVGEVDRRLGLVPGRAPFGGAARIASLLERERGRAGRVLHLDSGDVFQGAPIFNFFRGAPEVRFLDLVHADAMVIGNHEFDLGGTNLFRQLDQWAFFPVLAANYRWEDPTLPYNSHLGEVADPVTIMNLWGLRVGIIGLANLSSMNSIYDTGNRLGITPLEIVQTTQRYVDTIKDSVDVIVVLSHLGLNGDEFLIRGVPEIDVVLGGHHHVVLNPPKMVTDPFGRVVPMVHSGAFAKYIGRFDMVLRQCDRIPACTQRWLIQWGRAPRRNDWEIVSSDYQVFPVDSTVPEDPQVAEMLVEYQKEMEHAQDLNEIIGYAPNTVRRFGLSGGDSQLGNLLSSAMRERQGVQSDFALTNTLGIRADFVSGPVTMEQMFNVFPFENTITTLNLSGAEVQELFDFVADRSAGRGCSTQAQIAGAAVVLDCGPVCPPSQQRADGSCQVRLQPRARRVLIGDASPASTKRCRQMQEAFNRCCERVRQCGCDDDACLDSECEREAREEVGGCDTSFEPAYRTDPCESDQECTSRSPEQRCFVPVGQVQGRCMNAVVDEGKLLDPNGAYKLAANDYIARGGSGFRMLGRNTSQVNLNISLREVLVEFIRRGPPCTQNEACETDADCPNGELCACDAMARWEPGQGASDEATCTWDRRGDNESPRCERSAGKCVLAACADEVAALRGGQVMTCDEAADEEKRESCWCNARRWALGACTSLACINEELGATSDGRQTMVQP